VDKNNTILAGSVIFNKNKSDHSISESLESHLFEQTMDAILRLASIYMYMWHYRWWTEKHKWLPMQWDAEIQYYTVRMLLSWLCQSSGWYWNKFLIFPNLVWKLKIILHMYYTGISCSWYWCTVLLQSYSSYLMSENLGDAVGLFRWN
jgi:hypothetical protein